MGYQGAPVSHEDDPATLAAMGCDPRMPVLAVRLTRRALAGPGQSLLLSLSGAGPIALGLTYVLHAFGPTEAEVALWGRALICLGWALVPLTVGVWRSNSRFIKGIATLGWSIVVLLQIPPVLLWFAFHGSGISDGTPPSTFVAHWAYSIPHLAVLAASVAMVRNLLSQPGRGLLSRQPPSCEPHASSNWGMMGDNGNT